MSPVQSSVFFFIFVIMRSTAMVRDSGFAITRCVGDRVDLVWKTMVDVSQIDRIQWAFQASGANPEVLATFNKTTGFTAKDSRVEHLGGADLRMNNLTAKDDGIVLCSIHFRSGENTPSTVNLKACIHIDVPPVVAGEKLVLQMNSTAVKDESSGKWAVSLRCGSFLYPGHPIVYPTLKTPAGGFVAMTKPDDKFYVLPLTVDDVVAGQYQCSLPEDPVCRHSPPAPATVNVDAARVQLILMNARLQDTELQNTGTKL